MEFDPTIHTFRLGAEVTFDTVVETDRGAHHVVGEGIVIADHGDAVEVEDGHGDVFWLSPSDVEAVAA